MIDWPSFLGGMLAASAFWLVAVVCASAFSRRSTPPDRMTYETGDE